MNEPLNVFTRILYYTHSYEMSPNFYNLWSVENLIGSSVLGELHLTVRR